ncbi:MAG: DUF1501 domain-containing protein [Spirochaetes bacterium]|nr:DUF1501 domain-containing protein [Spirochaetota bacterium]
MITPVPNSNPTRSRRIASIAVLAALAGVLLAPASAVAADRSPPPAKSVIQIWMWGGPSHLDTFDPKPNAGSAYTGPLNATQVTNVPGIEIGQLFPRLARQADKYSIIRSMTHGINSHETAAYLMQTGNVPGSGAVFPSLGAIVSWFKGYRAGYSGEIPPYVVLTEAQGRFAEEGFLGPAFKPFVTGGDPARNPFAVEGLVAEGLSDEQQRRRRAFMDSLDSLPRSLAGNPLMNAAERAEARAYDMILGEARKVFDMRQESADVRERYGLSSFGQACLVARRLVERGVPYVTINYKGWDTHKDHFEIMARRAPELDQGLATLLTDLAERGLLDSTIVYWGGEFGRTPRVDWDAPWNGGRGHYGACFSVLLAGGGFKGGMVVGASDATGERVVSRPVYPRDLIASILLRLGIDPAGTIPGPSGTPVRLVPETENRPGFGILTEIM